MQFFSRRSVGAWVGVVLAAVVACGGSSSSSQSDTSAGTGGTSAQGGSAGTKNGSGGSGGGAIEFTDTCPDFTPCGGDVVGTWSTQSVCGTAVGGSSKPECSDELQSSSVTGEATYTYGADGTVTLTGTVSVDAQLTITDACAQATSGFDAGTFCGFLDLAYGPDASGGSAGSGDSAGTAGSDPAPVVFDCTFASADQICNCDVTEIVSNPKSETYTVTGNELTVTDQQGKPQVSDYCVSGDTLTVRTSTSVGEQIAVLVRQ